MPSDKKPDNVKANYAAARDITDDGTVLPECRWHYGIYWHHGPIPALAWQVLHTELGLVQSLLFLTAAYTILASRSDPNLKKTNRVNDHLKSRLRRTNWG
jgi:hypothetical protein